MTERCRTCRHWARGERDGGQLPNLPPSQTLQWSECDRANGYAPNGDRGQPLYLFADNPDGLCLATREDFGCTEWKRAD